MTAIGNLTGALAIAIGLYAAAAGLGMLTAPDRFRQMIANAENSPALNFAIGILVFSVGTAIALTHPMGEGWLSILVTITGWGMAIEGLLFLAAPQIIWSIARPMASLGGRIGGTIATLAGAAFVWAGYCHL
ncbi:DUF2065 domain-containing protein [Parasphingopyxis sp. CP4]|uniref:DUF2065 domain-containing protein n=1 Tax=Parasphingopyxis sp. CP4 TaxID=2724527 RepID=UPI0015A38666|nr:DUF2065 domain-containing protein [Parasphingopyxis sp. CP4]QLC22795.1 DUF2065 domain-containing protein [Parasphingopyxis sp. CP4]